MTLTLASAVIDGQEVTVTYAVPVTNPIRDVVGNAADGLSNDPVRNATPDTTPPRVSMIEITSNPGTRQTYGVGAAIEVSVTFSETVRVDTTNGTPDLALTVGAETKPATYDHGSDSDTLVFAYPVASGDSDTDGVSIAAGRIDLNGGTIQDSAANDAELDHETLPTQAGHTVDGIRPMLPATGGAVVSRTTLALTYGEPLDTGSVAEPGDFTLDGGDHARTVTGVALGGASVKLTLDPGAEYGEAGIRVSYTPGTNPIRDAVGNEAEALSRVAVTNETPDTTSPTVSTVEITSTPPDNRDTYAIGDVIEATVTFDETVEVEGTPRLTLRVGSWTRPAGYLRGSGTSEPVFGYEVVLGDEDTDGVSIAAGRIDLNGGTIQDGADNDAEPAHETLPAQAGHKVDGVRPEFLSAAVEGASLTLAYGEALEPASRPAAGDFTVEVGSSGRSVSGVSVSGSVVTLFLNTAVEHSRYGDPGELQSGGAAAPGRGGQRGGGTEHRGGDQYHGGAQHGAGDHERGTVRHH